MSWTVFGILLGGVVLHTAALSFQLEEQQHHRWWRPTTQQQQQQVIETLFTWNGLITALAVVIAPKKEPAQCAFIESALSSTLLVAWSLVSSSSSSGGKDGGGGGFKAVVAIHALLALGLAQLAPPHTAYTRLGISVCYLEFPLTHAVVAVVHARALYLHLKQHRRRRQEDEGDEGEEASSFSWITSLLACVACVVLWLAWLLDVHGSLPLWDVWMLVSGATAVQRAGRTTNLHVNNNSTTAIASTSRRHTHHALDKKEEEQEEEQQRLKQ